MIAAVAMLAVFTAANSPFVPEWAKFYGNMNIPYLALGIGTYYLWRISPSLSWQTAALLVNMAVAALIGWSIFRFFQSASGLALILMDYMFPSALVASCLVAHDSGLRTSSRALLFIGAASYSIYLTHLIIITGMQPFLPMLTLGAIERVAAEIVTLVALVTIGCAAYVWVERPIIRALTHFVGISRVPVAAAV